jgi:hypothetical protein
MKGIQNTTFLGIDFKALILSIITVFAFILYFA